MYCVLTEVLWRKMIKLLVKFDLRRVKDWTSLCSSTQKVTQTETVILLSQISTVRAIDVELKNQVIHNRNSNQFCITLQHHGFV